MSLRPHEEQVAYEIGLALEAWSLAVIDACRAAGVEPPCDFRWRWQMGQSVEEVVAERRLAAGLPMRREAA